MADPLTVLDDGSEIAARLRKFYPTLLELASADAADTLGVDLAFTLDNPRVQATLTSLAHKVTNVADTTKDDIRRLVGQAAAEGWGPAELARAIRAAGVTSSVSRAASIARTESAAAYTAGSLLAYADSGVVAKTEWLLGPDPCPDCAPLAGKQVPLGAQYPGGVDGPPLHPHCTCAVTPVLKGS